jgi:hypothetical protein
MVPPDQPLDQALVPGSAKRRASSGSGAYRTTSEEHASLLERNVLMMFSKSHDVRDVTKALHEPTEMIVAILGRAGLIGEVSAGEMLIPST